MFVLVLKSCTVWPANLVTCALFNTLHAQTYAGIGNRGGLSREKFFLYAFIASSTWYIFPGYLFQALSYFSWVCWIAPDNIPINQMFGYIHGMGMSLITFDWAQVSIHSSRHTRFILTNGVRLHILALHWLRHGGPKPTLQLALFSFFVSYDRLSLSYILFNYLTGLLTPVLHVRPFFQDAAIKSRIDATAVR
jgi:hypothetical protein